MNFLIKYEDYEDKNDYFPYYFFNDIIYENLDNLISAFSNGEVEDINLLNRDGDSALHISVDNYNIEIINCLLENGADIDIRNSNGDTPLCLAIYNNDYETIKLLLENGADINVYDSEGRTVMNQHLIENGDTDILRLLIEYGADIEEKYDDKTPLIYTIINNSLNETIELIKAGANTSSYDNYKPIFMVIDSDDNINKYNCFNELIKSGIDIEEKNNDGYTILNYICDDMIDNRCDYIKLLIKAGANVNTKNSEFNTPLYNCYFDSDVESVIELIKAGADIGNENPDDIFDDSNFIDWYNNDLQETIIIYQPYNISFFDEYIPFNSKLRDKYKDEFESAELGLL